MTRDQFVSKIHQIADQAKRAQLELAIANISENDPRWKKVEECNPIATFEKAFGVSLRKEACFEYNFEARYCQELCAKRNEAVGLPLQLAAKSGST